MGQSQELADPRYYVEFIDWNDLKGISEAELQHAGISTDIPFARQDKSTQWLTWTPPYKSLAWSHHFHTEDEVFEYNMLQWPLPDHYLDDQVIFHAREITRTDFIGNLEQFWEAWVCLCLAQSKQTYLTQTDNIIRMTVPLRSKIAKALYCYWRASQVCVSGTVRSTKTK